MAALPLENIRQEEPNYKPAKQDSKAFIVGLLFLVYSSILLAVVYSFESKLHER